MSPRRSPTFRSGRPGEWRQVFTDKNVSTFKHATGDLALRWGYEPGRDRGHLA